MDKICLKRPQGLKGWGQLYRLYMAAFPASERKPFSMIRRMYRKGRTDIWCLHRDGRFVGLAITINGPRQILLDYFAIAAKDRGQGVGSASLAAIRSHYQGKGLFLEIESTLIPSPERELRLRRKRFYLAAGMEELGVQVKLFGVDMELLGYECAMSFEAYQRFYRENYNAWAAGHIAPGQLSG